MLLFDGCAMDVFFDSCLVCVIVCLGWCFDGCFGGCFVLLVDGFDGCFHGGCWFSWLRFDGCTGAAWGPGRGLSISSGVSEAKPEAPDAGKKQQKTRLSHHGWFPLLFLLCWRMEI